MPFIQNIALRDIMRGDHRDVEGNGILIQILDPDWEDFPVSPVEYKEIHQFRFLDVEEDFPVNDESMRVSDEQAEQIAAVLKRAYESGTNVIVHCHAGVCRSGAVTEVGVRLGFEDTGRFRVPNRAVLKKLIKYLPECDFRPFQEEEPKGSDFE